jgi:hypothetical protein
MDKSINLEGKINGWGADLDPANRPGVPMERTPLFGTGAHWTEPDQQVSSVKVFKSIERPDMTAVFGTTCPPKGLSGKVRDVAYSLGEDRISRWLYLLIADRIDVLEGIGQDLARGYVPNIFAEMGWKAEWKYNRKAFVKRMAVTGAVACAAAGAVMWMRGYAKSKRVEA